jgi:hypothetical protein
MNAKQWSCRQRCLCFAAAALATSVSMGVHAEYLCKAPPTAADKRACELAKLDRPDDLRFFVQRTRGVYGLYMLDYVTEADAKRWELARGSDESRANVAIDAGEHQKSVSR